MQRFVIRGFAGSSVGSGGPAKETFAFCVVPLEIEFGLVETVSENGLAVLAGGATDLAVPLAAVGVPVDAFAVAGIATTLLS